MKNKLILLLLSLLGLASCNNSPDGPDGPDGPDYPAMYGVPTASFTIKGRVTDTGGQPIDGIRIVPLEAWHQNIPTDSYIPDQEIERDEMYPQTLYTNPQGEYEIRNECFGWWSEFNVTIQLDDVDGVQNGGEFAARKADIPIKQADRTEQGTWVSTYDTQAADIVLEKAEQ